MSALPVIPRGVDFDPYILQQALPKVLKAKAAAAAATQPTTREK